MQQEAISALPWWAQIFVYLVIAVGLGFFAVRQYLKPRSSDTKSEGQIVAAAIFDRMSMERLSNSLDRAADHLERHEHAARRLCDCLEENTDQLRKALRHARSGGE